MKMLKARWFRCTLFATVEAFQENTPASLVKARRLMRRLGKASGFGTLDGLIWDGYISELSDSLFYKDAEYLAELRATLQHSSVEIHRAYLNYDFRPECMPEEQQWFTQLWTLLEFLERLPADDVAAAEEEYERQVNTIYQTVATIPAPADPGAETIFHFLLREVTAVLTTVDVRHSLVDIGWMIPVVPYTSYCDRKTNIFEEQPAIGQQVAWARRVLRALAGEEWTFLTWQVTATHYFVSAH
jgi:hypothetical protein